MLELRQTCAIIASEVIHEATWVRSDFGDCYARGRVGRVPHFSVQAHEGGWAKVYSWEALSGKTCLNKFAGERTEGIMPAKRVMTSPAIKSFCGSRLAPVESGEHTVKGLILSPETSAPHSAPVVTDSLPTEKGGVQ